MMFRGRLVTTALLGLALLLGVCESRGSAPFLPSQKYGGLHQKQQLTKKTSSSVAASWQTIPRGGDAATATTEVAAKGIATLASEAITGLSSYLSGGKSDTLLLLLTTALNAPICKTIGLSPILGFLISGLIFGPKGLNMINDIHTTEHMADIGIVFFLFEMGIHLDFKTLMGMKRDVFGLGGLQFLLTGLAVAMAAGFCGLPPAVMIILGGGLALSSSAFVLQLLKDKNQMETEFGKKSFGVLLLQDLAVVPLLVITPILAGDGGGLANALSAAGVQAAIALTTIGVIGKFLIKPFFDFVAKAKSQETFVGAILFTILGMSMLTEGLGLSNTLGAFLAGVLLSETEYNHAIEKEIAPFRGILVGLFFYTVGFEIDLDLIKSKFPLVASIVVGLMATKTVIAGGLARVFGLSLGTAQQVGLILSQGGEFAFVAFRLARSYGILSEDLTKLMLTCVSLTMGATPMLEEFGSQMAAKLNGPPPKPGKKAPAGKSKKK